MHVRDIQMGQMRHRVLISSMKDEILNGQMILTREGVLKCWAQIEDWRPTYIAPTGFVVDNPEEKQTHEIYIRYRTDMVFSTSAWIYNERLKSPPRWFKVLGFKDVDEAGRFICFSCKLTQLSDSVVQPQPPKAEPMKVQPLPDGVRL